MSKWVVWGAIAVVLYAVFTSGKDAQSPASAPAPAPNHAPALSETEREAAVQALLATQKAKEAERCANEPRQVLSIVTDLIKHEAIDTASRILDGCKTLPAKEVKALRAQITKVQKTIAAQNDPKNFGVTIGMTPEEALASNWGKPQSVNTTTTAHGVREQWVYGGRSYLYFTNGKLTSIQN